MSLASRLLAPAYDFLVAPCETACVMRWRQELLDPLAGDVLEIGGGTGANLAHFGPAIDNLIVAEPDPHMRRRLQKHPLAAGINVTSAPAERLEVADASLNAVVSTLVLCTVKSPAQALAEIHRVLRPGGALVFIEHVRASGNPRRLTWQRRLEPLWKRIFAGCHLTRDTEEAIRDAGFSIESIERESMQKAAPVVRPTIRGVARKAR